MNKQKFKQIVRNYHELSAQDRIDLHELVKDNPYSQILHSLVAKANNDAQTDIAKQSLNYAAMYASDRSVLRDIIQSKPKPAADLSQETKEPTKTIKEPSKPVKEAVADAIQTPKEHGSKSENIGVKKKGKVITVDTDQLIHKSDDLIKEVWQDLAALKKSKAAYLSKPDSTLEQLSSKEIKPKATKTSSRTKSTSASTKSKVTGKTTTTSKNTTATTTKKKSSAKASSTSGNKTATASNTRKTTPKKPTTRTPAAKSVKKTAVANKPTGATKKTPAKTVSKTRASTEGKASTTTKAQKTTTKTAASTAKKTPASSKKKAVTNKATDVDSQKKIIENFIDNEPRISAKTIKAAETNQKDLSEKSTVYSEDLISENLAQILLAQGKKEKAVDIYKKLIWKFPQKRSYFAAQIEKIKNN